LQVDLRWLPFEIHPETPPEGAAKPFPPEAWPQVRAMLERLGREVGLSIDPPKRNVNSRLALETAELVRAQKGDDAAGAFYHDVSRAFFAEHADISKPEVIIAIAERFGISASDVEAAWRERRFSPAVDAFIEMAHAAGVTGVPAMGWPHRRAIVGMMPAADLVVRLRNEAPLNPQMPSP
jgi:predicted DsbA family dithiol-disulfide isomerase